MAATAVRPPDASEDSLSTLHSEGTGLGRTASYRRQLAYDGEDDYPPVEPENPNPNQNPTNPAQQTPNRLSFAERTKNNARPSSWIDKPLPPSPPAAARLEHGQGQITPQRRALASNPPDSPRAESTPAPTNPTTSQQSTSTKSQQQQQQQRHSGWAPDRSPLQKLEVALDGISKEEKRARVLEAELRVKERLDRQAGPGGDGSDSHESTGTGLAATPAAHTKRRSVGAPSISDQSSRSLYTPQGINPEDRSQDSQEKARREKVHAAQGESPSFRYAAVPRDDLRYAKPSGGQPVATMGSTAPRRAVSVSHHPERLGTRPGKNRMSLQEGAVPKRALSHAVPAADIPPRKPVPRQFDDGQGSGKPPSNLVSRELPGGPGSGPSAQQQGQQQGQGQGPAAAMASGAVPPSIAKEPPTASSEWTGQTKPKRHTVSFNVPPPTPPPLSDWKNAPVARLGLSDFEFQNFDLARSKAWWGGGNGDRRRSRALPNNYQVPNQRPACKFNSS